MEHALDLGKPGGLSAVAADVKDTKTAAESAFVATQALASVATAKPGLPELTEAVSAHTDALRLMEATVRATGPQPVVSMPAPPAVPPAVRSAKDTKGGTP